MTKNTNKMGILVTIANFGTKNDPYLRQLLTEYASMSHKVHVVVLTNVPKSLGEDIEVVVTAPRGNPWAFPFAHKRILADRLNDYDLFIYSEDDTLITERNIDAFLRVTAVLPKHEIAGFVRSEKSPDGATYFCTVHNHFHWDPSSVISRGPFTLAHFTNEHAASYILTRDQLKQSIASGGFLVEPHQGKYGLLESAATDPYTRCGFRKLICISEIRDFTLPHIPNKYIGRMGLKDTEFALQISALEAIHNKTRRCEVLLARETNAGQGKWSKKYYEPLRYDLLDQIPHGSQRVLSFGCGTGELEAELMRRGMRVTAVPLDSVVGVCAEAKGIEVVYGNPESALAKIESERFDCIVANNILHLFPEPGKLLFSLSGLLASGGIILVTVPNLQQLPVWWNRISRNPAYANLSSFEHAGLHVTSYRKIRKWFAAAGLQMRRAAPVIPKRAERVYGMAGKWSRWCLASEFLIAGTKIDSQREAKAVLKELPASQKNTVIEHVGTEPRGVTDSLVDHKPTCIAIMGATLDTTNLGLGALAAGAIRCLLNAFPQADIRFLDYGQVRTVQTFKLQDRDLTVPVINMRFSKRFYLPNNIAVLLLTAVVLRTIPFEKARQWVLSKNTSLREIQQTAIIASISGGDSFSDIYGMERFFYFSLPQLLALLLGKELVLLPQTIGPFRGRLSKIVARCILSRAKRVYSRDFRSLDELRVFGQDQVTSEPAFCYDLGFVLDSLPPAHIDLAGLPPLKDCPRPLIGLNISGLLFMGGYTRNNMFGLRANYRNLVKSLIEFLILKKGASVVLVPHVFGSDPNSESDETACERIYEEVKDKYQSFVGLIRGQYNQNEIKYVIGQCDFFIGSRMHACIAAVSQCVPAVCVAYSDKFIGVMETIGIESIVADARKLDINEILRVVDSCLEDRATIRRQLEMKMPEVRSRVLQLFTELAGLSGAAPVEDTKDASRVVVNV
jgi:colanic acid/amylovoran biosynthesis protein